MNKFAIGSLVVVILLFFIAGWSQRDAIIKENNSNALHWKACQTACGNLHCKTWDKVAIGLWENVCIDRNGNRTSVYIEE